MSKLPIGPTKEDRAADPNVGMKAGLQSAVRAISELVCLSWGTAVAMENA